MKGLSGETDSPFAWDGVNVDNARMPSGRTHDFISLLAVPPVYLAAEWLYPGDMKVSLVAAASALFAGLMFGPDLDIKSKPYARWGPLGFIWWPYRFAVSHRSRLSHGLVFGTIFRLLYFIAVTAALGATVFWVKQRYINGIDTDWSNEFRKVSADIRYLWESLDKVYFWAVFGGLWAGAAVHTLTDLIWTILKKVWKVL